MTGSQLPQYQQQQQQQQQRLAQQLLQQLRQQQLLPGAVTQMSKSVWGRWLPRQQQQHHG
jgi:hypothetical protein